MVIAYPCCDFSLVQNTRNGNTESWSQKWVQTDLLKDRQRWTNKVLPRAASAFDNYSSNQSESDQPRVCGSSFSCWHFPFDVQLRLTRFESPSSRVFQKSEAEKLAIFCMFAQSSHTQMHQKTRRAIFFNWKHLLVRTPCWGTGGVVNTAPCHLRELLFSSPLNLLVM